MSNAAVVKLNRVKLPGKEVWLDDNYAESIHIHINDFRCDLTCKNFAELCEQICDAINELIKVDGFNINSIDPVFFQQSLYMNIRFLTAVKIENVKLSDLWIYDGRLRPLSESHVMKGLKGDEKAGNMKRKSDRDNQTGMERIIAIDDSIKQNGYPYDGKYIIVYNNENVIRDGQHRACSLLKEKGNIEVPVMRLFFSNYQDINIKKRATLLGEFTYRASLTWPKIKNFRRYGVYIRKGLQNIKDKGILRIKRRQFYKRTHQTLVADAVDIFDRK